MLLQTIPVGLMGVNCYVLGDKSEAIVIDPGASAEKIYNFLNLNNLKVKYIVLTHCHFDHILAVNNLKEKTGAKVVVSKSEAENLADSSVNLTDKYSREEVIISPDILVTDGDVILSGKAEFKVIETPGHTSGGMCLYGKNEGVLFSGDTLFYGSVGRCDLPTGNAKTLINSIKTKLLCLPDDTRVYPGHGESTTILFEKNNNPYLFSEADF